MSVQAGVVAAIIAHIEIATLDFGKVVAELLIMHFIKSLQEENVADMQRNLIFIPKNLMILVGMLDKIYCIIYSI